MFHGTWGTIPAVFIFWAISGLPFLTLIGITVMMFSVGVPLTQWVAQDMQKRNPNQAVWGKQSEDPGVIVWDEWVGYFVTALFTLLTPGGWGWLWIAFGLFRFFDMLKPIFVKKMEKRIKGGLGIMLDDVVAGVLAGLGIIILRYAPSFQGVTGAPIVVYLLAGLCFYFADMEEARKMVNRIHQS